MLWMSPLFMGIHSRHSGIMSVCLKWLTTLVEERLLNLSTNVTNSDDSQVATLVFCISSAPLHDLHYAPVCALLYAIVEVSFDDRVAVQLGHPALHQLLRTMHTAIRYLESKSKVNSRNLNKAKESRNMKLSKQYSSIANDINSTIANCQNKLKGIASIVVRSAERSTKYSRGLFSGGDHLSSSPGGDASESTIAAREVVETCLERVVSICCSS